MSGGPFLVKAAVSLDVSVVGELLSSLAGCGEGAEGIEDGVLIEGESLPSLADCGRGAEGVEGVITVGESLPSLAGCGTCAECKDFRAGELLPLLGEELMEVSIEVALIPEF